ncbi:MAG TPA: hypothetical protein VIN57_06075 [Magnetovibrio sp.]
MQALKGVVILMTVVIAVLMTLIVYGMYQKSQDPSFKFFDLSGNKPSVAAPQPATSEMPAVTDGQTAQRAFGDVSLDLPTGAQIVSTSVADNRLIIVVAGPIPGGQQVWVVDIATGQVLGRIKAQGAP